MLQEAEAGKRLARDMRRIREARNLTVDDLHHETKIPLGLIQAFEDTGLFDHPQFNRVYLRSFMRTYAQVVGVDADLALEALEEALAGRYSDALAAEYLGEGAETAASDAEVAEGGEATESGDDAAKVGERPSPEADDPSRADFKEPTEDAPEGESLPGATEMGSGIPHDFDEELRIPPLVSTTGEVAAGEERRLREEDDSVVGESESEEQTYDADWASQSPPPGRRSSAAIAAHRPIERSRTRTGRADIAPGAGRGWLVAAGIIVVAAAVIWLMISTLDGEPDVQAEESMAAADTTQVEDTVDTQPISVAPIELPEIGDTLNIFIIAAHDAVDPIRVTVDDDLRRPYWIDHGDSLGFRAANRIVIEELLDNIALSVEGIEYPTDRRDQQGRIVINRDSIENYFASLRQGL